MSTLENNIVVTEKFIDNAVFDDQNQNIEKEGKKESEKLILDQISNEKFYENQPNNINDNTPETCHLTSPENEDSTNKNVSEDLDGDTTLKPSKAFKSGNENSSETNYESTPTPEEDSSPADESAPTDEWQDLLGSGVIMKKILKHGETESRPTRSEKCIINFTCRLEESDEENFINSATNFEMALGEGDVVQGLDVAIGLMNKNERCLLKIGSRLAYGVEGLPPHIPSNATVVYDVELVDVQNEDDFETLGIKERRRMGNKKRERGNWWYHRGENTLAVQCYRRALDFLDEVENESSEKPTDAELQELLEDRLKVLNNMASAQIKMELYDQALISLQTVLRCQPDNVKALFRKAKVHTAKNDLQQALKLLEKAKSLEPEDGLITREIGVVSGYIQKQKNSEREYARRMFGGSQTSGATGKSIPGRGENKEGLKPSFQVWATLGATIIVGLAGAIAYKFKFS